jgi:hypothetical protein
MSGEEGINARQLSRQRFIINHGDISAMNLVHKKEFLWAHSKALSQNLSIRKNSL